MNIVSALNKLKSFFEKEKIPYMVFGGLAVGIYGYERMTYDIDVKAIYDLSNDSLNKLIKKLNKIANVIPKDPVKFINNTMVLPIEIEDVKIDLVFAGIDYEKDAVNRAELHKLMAVEVKIVTIEDLIIQKSISERDKDWNDIKNLIAINKKKINWDYLINKITEFSEILDNFEMKSKILKFKDEC